MLDNPWPYKITHIHFTQMWSMWPFGIVFIMKLKSKKKGLQLTNLKLKSKKKLKKKVLSSQFSKYEAGNFLSALQGAGGMYDLWANYLKRNYHLFIELTTCSCFPKDFFSRVYFSIHKRAVRYGKHYRQALRLNAT